MSKYVVLGDIHGDSNWFKVIENHLIDDYKIIFLGDYVSTHQKISGEEQFLNLLKILEIKEEFPEKIILLRGNHDLQHLGYSWADCSGFNRYVYNKMSTPEFRNRFLSLTQWLVYDEKFNICFSHAGISNTWFQTTCCKNLDQINTLDPGELFAFTPNYPYDYYGDSVTQPLTWIRPQALISDAYQADKLIQVVGHTTYSKIISTKKLFKQNNEKVLANIWLCDAFPHQYLLIKDGKFIVQTL